MVEEAHRIDGPVFGRKGWGQGCCPEKCGRLEQAPDGGPQQGAQGGHHRKVDVRLPGKGREGVGYLVLIVEDEAHRIDGPVSVRIVSGRIGVGVRIGGVVVGRAHRRHAGSGVDLQIRGTSLVRKRTPLGPYRRPMPRVLVVS